MLALHALQGASTPSPSDSAMVTATGYIIPYGVPPRILVFPAHTVVIDFKVDSADAAVSWMMFARQFPLVAVFFWVSSRHQPPAF